MTTSRRDFLRTIRRTLAVAGGSAAVGHLGGLLGQAQTATGYRALVCVFLFGGNDSNNTFLPTSSKDMADYTASRSRLALTGSQLLPVTSASGAGYAFHSSASALRDLFAQRKLAVLANTGTLVRPLTKQQYLDRSTPVPVNLFSHSDQQLQWQSGGRQDPSSGWGGRAGDKLGLYNAGRRLPATLAVGGSALFCVGAAGEQVATISTSTPIGLIGTQGTPDADARVKAVNELLALNSGAALVQAAAGTAAEGIRQAEVLQSTLAGKPRLATSFPLTELGQQLKQVAEVIRVRGELNINRQIFFCSLGGFDTHVGQMEKHAALLRELSGALDAFYDATLELGVERQVTTFTHSEFGRTLQQTSSYGSDHGWGGHQFILGGSVRGGEVYGRFPSLALGGNDDASGRGVLIPTTSVDQYVATLAQWAGVAAADLVHVLPNLKNFPTTNLGFLS